VTIDLPSERHTLALGAALASCARNRDVIALSGPLGAGKTSLARGFIQHLAATTEEIVSPTFTLVQTYDTPGGMIWHFDLYRLDAATDMQELGFDEAQGSAITLMEWPERMGALLPRRRLDVILSQPGAAGRTATLAGDAWAERLIS